MSDLGGVLVFVLGFAACVVVLSGICAAQIAPSPQHAESLADRWRKLTEMLPK